MPTASPSRRPRHRRERVAPPARLLAALLTVTLLIAGCGGEEQAPAEDPDQPPEEPVTIRLSWGTPGQVVFYVMQHLPEVAPQPWHLV